MQAEVTVTFSRRTVASSNQFLDLGCVVVRMIVPHTSVGSNDSEVCLWYPVVWWRFWDDRVPQFPTFQTCPYSKLETVHSTTAPLIGRDRSQSRCVLRRNGSEPKPRWTGEWRLPHPL